MQSNEIINSPGDCWILAAVAGVLGGILFLIANLIMKATGDNIDRHARESRRYRNMSFTEQMTDFHSDPRNIPVALGMGGFILLFAAICMAVGGIIWLLIRAV